MALNAREMKTDSLRRPPGIETESAGTAAVLLISPIGEDHEALIRILSRTESPARAEGKWTIYPARTLASALQLMRENPVAIVLSECDLFPGTWKDVLAELSKLFDPPMLIVASRLADEYLWAEALNLGAYDVLAKPFEREEVIRVLRSAWRQKRTEVEARSRTTLMMAASA